MPHCPRLTLRATLCLLPLALAGCRSTQPASETSAASRATSSAQSPKDFAPPRDDLGREIALKAPAQRVIVVGPGAVETMFALGVGAKIVGRDSAADFPAQIKSIPIVADYRGPFIEASVAKRPDLVLLQGETWGRERVENWQKKIGAPVAALASTTVADVQSAADKVAAWTGVPKRNLGIDTPLKTARGGANSPSAFIQISRAPLWTAGRGTLVADVVGAAGLRSVAGDVEGYKAFSKEALLKRQPDFYVTSGKPQEKARIVAELRRDAALGALKCVQRGQVLVVPGDFLLRPGPRLREGIQALKRGAQPRA